MHDSPGKISLRGWLAALRRVSPERLVLLLLALLAIGLWAGALCSLPRPFEVVSFPVGDGDAFMLRAPAGRTMLIDGGSNANTHVGEQLLVPYLALLGVRRVDAILITHPDSDHLNGLAAVIEAMPVGMVLENGMESDGTAYQHLEAVIAEKSIQRHILRAGDRLNLDARTRLSVVHPVDPLIRGTHSDTNNNCITCLLECGRARMLFTGDLEFEGEDAILARNADLRADVLKVAHHGSRYGSSNAFLDAVRPQWALLSCAGNPEHPHAETLARLKARGIRIFRTDVLGEISLTTDGRTWQVHSYREGER